MTVALRGFLVVQALLTATVVLAAPQSPTVVSGHLVLEMDGAHAGSTVKAAVVAQVAPGYHINAHVPSLDYLIPTELKLEPVPPLALGPVVYPKGKPEKFAFLDQPISVYEGRLLVIAPLKVAASAEAGVYTLKGVLNYQACNDHACLPPASLPLSLAVKVVPNSESLKRVNSDVFTGIKPN
ncbi:MAG TPA: protein-disulfide reductase DsbD domain-containing protein [Terriglobia bacterium]